MNMFAEAAERVDRGADPHDEARAIVAAMTLEEKLGCLDGDVGFWPGLAEMMGSGYGSRPWPAARVDRLGVPGIDFADGPRGCVMGPATTFPVSMARGASFDPALEQRVGEAIGTELRAQGATYTGAVCMNLLRHPAWGRAQETYGEDPLHVGTMATALTVGLQRHVMACMKHFALNSMENARFTVDVRIDERALHEVFLPHFKQVAAAGVASVMSSYNSVNGEWAGQNEALLTTILRDEWGWDGFVITDFIVGLRDPVRSVQAGCNIEMPFAQQRAVVLTDAVADGRLAVADVDARVAETVATLLRFRSVFAAAPSIDVVGSDAHRELAREAATASTVLLRNDGLLPLDASALGRLAVLGRLAAVANLGDAGSSNVVATPDPVAPLDGLRAALPDVDVVHADDDVSIVEEADAVVVVVGFTKEDEGEYLGSGLMETLGPLMPPMDHPVVGTDDPDAIGTLLAGTPGDGAMGHAGGDRAGLRLRPEDEALIEAAGAAHDRVIVAVVAGSAVVMPWLEQTAASLMLWYAGSESGTALADVLTGTEPGGRLPFVVPHDETDLVPFDRDATSFRYELLHGQWWLDANAVDAHLPFGHGLSYAEPSIIGATRIDEGTVSVDVGNAAERAGSTVVFVFGSVPGSTHERPIRRLVGFTKVSLAPLATTTVAIPVDLAQLDVRLDGRWVREDGVVLSVGLDAATTIAVD
ncbi:MAG: glycoside hydrolase family 3 N-terminal domain-containing protein [Actinomycetota bacterium]